MFSFFSRTAAKNLLKKQEVTALYFKKHIKVSRFFCAFVPFAAIPLCGLG